MTERQASPRHPVILPALCARWNGTEFHAVTVDMSTDGLKLRSATLPRPDEALTCHIRGVGAVESRVAWVGTCDFGVKVTGKDPAPGEVARRLIEMSRRQSRQSTVARVSPRIVPVHTAVQVTLEDGTRVVAQIINLSASGVALRLDASLAVGQSIVVGQQPATVARQNEHGIGAAFVEALDDGAVGEHTVL